MSDRSNDISGTWYGRYDATGRSDSNTFIAQIEQVGGSLSGTISEPDTSGQATVRRAFVAGRRAGTAIEFTKQYDGGVFAHAVRYWGIVNDDETEISGRWIIVRDGGTFVMNREKFSTDQLEDERGAELTVS